MRLSFADKESEKKFFSGLINLCPDCGNDVFSSVFGIIKNSSNRCANCRKYFEDFNQYWVDITGNTDELKIIASNSQAQQLLRRIFFSYSKRGIHKPLILPGAIKIEVTNRCNLSCKHCLANSGNGIRSELSLNEIERVIHEAYQLGVRSVGLVGGEPLLRKDLPRIIDTISGLNMLYSVSTNAILVNERIIGFIYRKNLVKVSVSIDGEEEYHNYIRGNTRAYSKALEGIRKLSKANIKVAVAMVVTRNNFQMIEHVINKAIDAGAVYFVINDLIPIGRGCEIRESMLSYPEYLEVTALMKLFSEKYKGKINILWKGMRPEGKSDSELGQFVKSICGAALTELTIDNEGFILPCPFLPKTSENVLHKSLEAIWYDSEEIKQYQIRDSLQGGCGSCERKLSCSGCRARALGHTQSLYGPDVRCPRCQS